ncbi:histidine kinase-, DNA gyrase B-, and HSP90-like ATPase family protein, partial [Vibrio parahaemolyticus V-223/04]
LRKITQSTKA